MRGALPAIVASGVRRGGGGGSGGGGRGLGDRGGRRQVGGSIICRGCFRGLSAVAPTAAEEAAAQGAAVPPRPFRDIPGPRAWPLVGSLPDFLSRTGGFEPPRGPQIQKAHHEYYSEFGSIFRNRFMGQTQITVCRPEEYIKMFRNEGSYPSGGAEMVWISKRWAECRNMQTYLKFAGRGEPWRSIRMVLQEDIISPQTARTYLPYINEACSLASPNFPAHSSDPDTFVTRIAFDMFSSLFYGMQMKTAAGAASPEDLEFVENTTRVFHLLGTSLYSPHLNRAIFEGRHPLLTEFEERLDRCYAYSEYLLERALAAAKDQPTECKPYIVRILESGKMPKEDIKQLAAALLPAGVDTTQSVINWNLLYLALNPSKQDRLRSELQETLGGGPLTPEVAAQMRAKLPYLRASVRETHRVAPPTPIMTTREAPCDLELDGFAVPKGTLVSFNTHAVQNDPRYVERPEVFEPERWLPEAVAARKGTEAAIIDDKLLATPFSFGARMCLGGRVADLETYAVLARLVQDWRISTAEERPSWKVLSPLLTKASPFPGFRIEKV